MKRAGKWLGRETPQANTTKAVILARGLGTRMRAENPHATLDSSQASVAETGVKAMIPVGRPFLDHVLTGLADAGFIDVCLVIGPEHGSIREYYERKARPQKLRIHFAEQVKPLGTADAVLAAEAFAGADSFVVLNSDNFYPASALVSLQRMSEPALIGFERDGLIELGNVPAERVTRFGALDIDRHGYLRRILAKPDETLDGQPVYASLNCWLFTTAIFRACREVTLSPRGELELPRAVQLAIDEFGMRFLVIRMREAVLDMSSRSDVVAIAERLGGRGVSF
jgi:dTDP-glucose pyrophosphorylase